MIKWMYQEVNIMKLSLKQLTSMTEANQNFSKVVKKIEIEGNIVILKNNKPKFLLFDYEKFKSMYDVDDLDITRQL